MDCNPHPWRHDHRHTVKHLVAEQALLCAVIAQLPPMKGIPVYEWTIVRKTCLRTTGADTVGADGTFARGFRPVIELYRDGRPSRRWQIAKRTCRPLRMSSIPVSSTRRRVIRLTFFSPITGPARLAGKA